MIQEHPLYFFIKLVNTDLLTQLKNEFYNTAFDNGQNREINTEDESIIVAKSQQDSFQFDTQFFKDYLSSLMEEEAVKTIASLDFQLINETDLKKIPMRLAVYQSSLDVLIAKVAGSPTLNQYAVISQTYSKLKEHLLQQAQYMGFVMKQPKGQIQMNAPKLQWTHEAKTLAQLFSKLYLENNNVKQPLIRVQVKDDMIDFIVNNFVDKKGNPYDRDNISDLLKPRSSRRLKSDDDFVFETIPSVDET